MVGAASGPTRLGVRSAMLGVVVNAVLALTKLVAGLVGNSYALVADAIESATDIVSSTIVWGGLRVAAREPDEAYPFGYGKAESLAAATVALLIVAAAIGVAIAAVLEIRTPHHAPATWTLPVLVGVIAIKWLLSRHVGAVGANIGSSAVRADAWHHLSDAVTSAGAFVGISIALIGGPGWEAADDWAALAAAAVILYNGSRMLRSSLEELMDRSPERAVVDSIRRAAHGVEGVLATEKLAVRKAGLGFRVTIHVQADPNLSLFDAHV
ncbi:MAG: cation diffusion facilitator family transporter, partial [Gemmatimonadaceae bacterium]